MTLPGGCRSATARALGVALGLLLVATAARAQAVAVVKTADDIPIFDQAIERLRTELDSVVVDSLGADRGRWSKVHDRLAKRQPAVWIPVGPLALQQAAAESSARPIVFMLVPSPDEALRSGGGIAGVTLRVDPAVQLREIVAILPDAERVGIVHDPSQSAAEVATARRAAAGVGVTVETEEIAATSGLGEALGRLLGRGVDVLWLVPDRTVTPPRSPEVVQFIAETAAKAGVPVVGYAEKLTEGGALFSLAPDYAEVGLQTSEMVRRVLAGEDAAAVGVQDVRKVSLSVNLRVAETLGIALPAAARDRAAQVFQ